MTEAAPEQQQATETEQPASESPTAEDIAKLNAALAKEREGRKEAERKAKENLAARAKLDEIEAASASELEKAVKAARDEATAAERTRAARILAAAEARAQAADRFRNPLTAVRLLDLDDVSVDEDGLVDAAAVTAKLNALAESDAYLLKDERPPIPTPGQAGIGVTGGAAVRDPKSADLAQIEADLAAAKRR